MIRRILSGMTCGFLCFHVAAANQVHESAQLPSQALENTDILHDKKFHVISIKTHKAPWLDIKSQCYACFVAKGSFSGAPIDELQKKCGADLRALMAEKKFTGESGDKFTLTLCTPERVMLIVIVGLGSPKKDVIDIEKYRRALGMIIREAESAKVNTISLKLPSSNLLHVSDYYLGLQTALIGDMAAYKFDMFLSDSNSKEPPIEMELALDQHDEKKCNEGISYGLLTAASIRLTRLIVDLPSICATPELIARKARDIAQIRGLTIKIFNGDDLKKYGLNGMSSVARGSAHQPRFVILEYKTTATGADTIAFVGKGVTFDSGGLNIKNAENMEYMKEDKAGAAVVLGAIDALAQLKPSVNIVAAMPLVENMPSGNAYIPGEIITMYNGKTVEVLNTDAEGRLILADALSYVVKNYKLDAVVDLATLTGAVMTALGGHSCGLFSDHDKLVSYVEKASALSGDRVWRLPIYQEYKKGIKSDYADIKNVGKPSYQAKASLAALFLQNFVGAVPWVHLDIAGTSFDVENISYYRNGSTGFGVRLLIELAMHWSH